MCGIVAVFQRDGRPVERREIEAMRDLLVHRGPDDCGAFVDGSVGLGHRRLSIIDIAGGHQPMSNESGSAHIVFNGEIYNYRELQEILRSRGVRIRTQSDTETILGLYEAFGEGCVEYLRGMFAFVIWDSARRRLIAARDRLGIKPLYLYQRGSTVALASEVKAFQAMPGWSREISEERIHEYLVYRDLAGEETLFRHVDRVAPAELLIFDEGSQSRHQYWNLPVPISGKEKERRKVEWVDELDAYLDSSIQDHMVSDVPIGTFNSGGVDSSLVTALTAKRAGNRLNTYSVAFDDPAYDESPFARIVANRYQTKHHTVTVSPEEFAESLPGAIWHLDEPLNHPNSIHLLWLSRLARQNVKVVLTGEGADELFGGYPRYRLPRLFDWLRAPVGLLRPLLTGLAGFRSGGERARIEATLGGGDGFHVAGLAAFVAPRSAGRLLRNDLSKDGRTSCGSAAPPELLAQTLWHDQRTYLQALLNRLDKMAMAASIEGRVPFLDHRLVEFAARIPPSLKLRGWRTKFALKETARRHLPDSIIDRRKAGLAVPVADWLRRDGCLGGYLDALTEPLARMRPYLDRRVLLSSVEEHRSGVRDHSEVLWGLINLELWLRMSNEERGEACTS